MGLGWIIAAVIIFALISLIRHMAGYNSTYGIFYYNVRVFTGSKEACQSWIENKISEEQNKLLKNMQNEFPEKKITKNNMLDEFRLLETHYRQYHKIIRLN